MTERSGAAYSSNDPNSILVFSGPSDDTPWLERLEHALNAQRIEAASQAAALASAMHSIETGTARNPYRFTRELGETSQAARDRPATAAYQAALDVLNMTPDALKHPVASGP